MPVLGAAGTSTTGSQKRGVYIPANWGATWKAARANHASSLVEVIIFGDSTTFGSCSGVATGTPLTQSFYSWVQRIRQRSIAAGFTDGGRGIAGTGDTAEMSAPDNLNAVQGMSPGGSWTASGDGNDFMLGETPYSTAANAAITMQGFGTQARIFHTLIGTSGGYSYSVNGGAATTVETDYNGFSVGSIYLTGLSGSPNTIVFTNLGGALVRPPDVPSSTSTSTASGTLAAGTYFYAVTSVDSAGGETLPSTATGGLTLAAPGQVSFFISSVKSAANNYTNATQHKIYRATSSGGTYSLISTITAPTRGGSSVQFIDNGLTTSTAAPTSNTATTRLAAGASQVRVVAEFTKSTGIVYQKQAISGISSGSFFATSNITTANPAAQQALGLTPGTTGVTYGPFGWMETRQGPAAARTPSLAIWALGINDMQGVSIATEGSPTATELTNVHNTVAGMKNNLANFTRYARAAGADPLVIVPHFEMANHQHTFEGMFAEAVWTTAQALGCAVIDFADPLRPLNTMSARTLGSPAVHAYRETYIAEADFLWDNCLNL